MAEPNGWIRLHPLSPLLLAGRYALGAFVILLQFVGEELVGSTQDGEWVVRMVGVILLTGLVALGYAAAAWRVRTYRVTEKLVELKTGIVFRSYRHLPLDRIESVDTAQPLIPRLLGLAEVRIEAVSQKGSELRLRYLSLPEAERLRGELSQRRRGDVIGEQAPAQSTPILRVPPRELIIGYLVLPAAIIVPALAVGGLVAGISSREWVAVIILVMVVATGLAPPALLRIERLWDFRLDDTNDALVINRGLLNLNTQRITTGRIQAVRVDQPLLWRPFKRFRVVVDVAGYRGVGKEEAAAAANLLPIGPEDVVRYLLYRLEVRTDLAALDFHKAPDRAKWRSPMRWRTFQVAWTDTHAVTRSGLLWRRTAVVPHAKVQSARVTQGPWQRHLRLASLHLDTAGGRIKPTAAFRDAREAIDLAQSSCRRVGIGETAQPRAQEP